jgi:hypothetical protein
MAALAAWQNFYAIVGSSAGALIGLQFVVMALVAGRPRSEELNEAGVAFSTPTIVHFSVVLLLAAAMSIPWWDAAVLPLLWAVGGLGGVAYTLLTARRLLRQSA